MAVAFDAATVLLGGTGDFNSDHTPVGTPRAAIVFIGQGDASDTDEITGVTYGGQAMSELTGSPNLINGGLGDIGGIYAYFLGSSIPTGTQNVAVTTSGSSDHRACVVTLTAAADTETVDIDATIHASAQTDPSVTLSLGGRTCFAIIGLFSGHPGVANVTPLANWTSIFERDHGGSCSACYRYDTIGTTDVTAGWTQTSEDAAMIAVAISEVAATGQPTTRRHGLSLPRNGLHGIEGVRLF